MRVNKVEVESFDFLKIEHFPKGVLLTLQSNCKSVAHKKIASRILEYLQHHFSMYVSDDEFSLCQLLFISASEVRKYAILSFSLSLFSHIEFRRRFETDEKKKTRREKKKKKTLSKLKRSNTYLA